MNSFGESSTTCEKCGGSLVESVTRSVPHRFNYEIVCQKCGMLQYLQSSLQLPVALELIGADRELVAAAWQAQRNLYNSKAGIGTFPDPTFEFGYPERLLAGLCRLIIPVRHREGMLHDLLEEIDEERGRGASGAWISAKIAGHFGFVAVVRLFGFVKWLVERLTFK